MKYTTVPILFLILASFTRGSEPSPVNTQTFKFSWNNSTSNFIVKDYRRGDDAPKAGPRFKEVIVRIAYPLIKVPPKKIGEKRRTIPAKDLGLQVIKFQDFKFVALDQRGEVLKFRPKYPESEYFGMSGKGHSSASVGSFLVSLDEDQELARISLAHNGEKATISLPHTKAQQQ
jgi:hypothetical protein